MKGWVMPPGTAPGTGEGGTGAAVEWVTVTAAMTRAGVSRRTIRRWIAEGRVESRLVEEDGREVRLIRGDTLPAAGAGDDTVTGAGAVRGDGIGASTGDGTGVGHGVGREGGTGDGLRELVTHQTQEIQHLRVQLDARTQAESELRRLLLVSQQALQAALERPALPPMPAPDPMPARRVRWWNPATWGRG
jgi:hypothetical protein